jgi:tetratricopeptide (TPR) repeat protein
MKLQNTLIISFILLIILSFNIFADEVSDKNYACNAALNKGDFNAAEKLANEVLKHDAKNREASICKGRLLGAKGNYDEALIMLNQAESLSKEPSEHIIGLILIGNIFKAQQKNSDALASYEGSLSIAKNEKNEKYIRANYDFIGDVLRQNNNLTAALANYQLGAKLAMNDNERAESFELLATAYKALGQYDAAIEYQVKAIQMQKLSGTLDQFADSTLALGQIYIAAKDYSSADKSLTKFAQFAKDNGGAYYEAKAKLYLAQCRAESGDAAAAKLLFADASSLAISINAKDLANEIQLKEKNLGY